MSSFSSLGIAFSGLRASQKAMEVVANNIANVNTEGYSRQRVELVNARPVPGTFGRRGDGMRGMGVSIADVIRIRSELADTSFRSQSATAASWSAQAEVMGRAEQVLGPVRGGAPAALAGFFAAWEELSLQPDSLAARQAVIQAGKTLAGSFSSAADELDQLGAGTAQQVRDGIDEVNRLAGQIAKLNAGIADATNGQQSPNDLLDQRDRLLDQLASLAGTTMRDGPMGTVDVYIGGRALVRGETVEQLQPARTEPETVRWAIDGIIVAPAGRLGGLSQAAGNLAQLRSNLNELADDLGEQVNTIHARPGTAYDLNGDPGLAFFTGSLASNTFSVNDAIVADARKVAASQTPVGGSPDGQNALEMAAARAALGTRTGKSAEDGLHGFAALIGGLSSEAGGTALNTAEILEALQRDRAEISSVSTDEEMADMVRFQRSYEAAARLMTTMDEMLDRLINHTGLVGR